MTALLAPRPSHPETGPGLAPVPPLRRQLATPWFIALLAAVLGLGMVGLLVLTTALQNQAFAVGDRQALAQALANDLSDLQARVADARSVQSLALAAQGLGMVPDTYPAQLRHKQDFRLAVASDRAREHMLKLLMQFGMTPSAATRVSATPEVEQDPFEKWAAR